MHIKEKVILAILGLFLSLGLLLASLYFTFLRPSTHLAQEQVPADPKPSPISISTTPSEAELQVLKAAKLYSDKVVESLLIKNNYEFVYSCFDKEIQEKYFKSDLQKCKNDLKTSFGSMGNTTSFSYTNQVVSPNKDKITCYYSILYQKKGAESRNFLQIFLNVKDKNFTLSGLLQQPIN